jgi:hypothetical protein
MAYIEKNSIDLFNYNDDNVMLYSNANDIIKVYELEFSGSSGSSGSNGESGESIDTSNFVQYDRYGGITLKDTDTAYTQYSKQGVYIRDNSKYGIYLDDRIQYISNTQQIQIYPTTENEEFKLKILSNNNGVENEDIIATKNDLKGKIVEQGDMNEFQDGASNSYSITLKTMLTDKKNYQIYLEFEDLGGSSMFVLNTQGATPCVLYSYENDSSVLGMCHFQLDFINGKYVPKLYFSNMSNDEIIYSFGYYKIYELPYSLD